MIRRVGVFLLCMLFLVSFAMGAGRGEAARPAPRPDIRMIWWGSQTRHERTIEVVEMYKQRNPNVDITFQFSSWGDYWTKVTTMAAGGQLPDVMQTVYERISEWVRRGLHVQLDDYVARGVIDTTDIKPAMIDAGRLEGRLWGICLGVNSHVMLLDEDMFKKAEVPIPPKDWTWEDFERIALQLHERLGVYGHGTALWDHQIWKALYISRGEWIYAPDNRSFGFTDDRPLIAHLEMMQRLIDAGALPTRPVEISQFAGGVENTPIVHGRSAMQHLWSNQVSAVERATGGKRNFVLQPLPRMRGGRSPNYIRPSMYFAVSSQSRFPEEAARFINFFTNSIEANNILLGERGIPINTRVQQAIRPQLPPLQKDVLAFIDHVTATGSPTPPPDAPGHGELLANVFVPQVIDKVLFGVIDPATAVRTLREKGNAILSRN